MNIDEKNIDIYKYYHVFFAVPLRSPRKWLIWRKSILVDLGKDPIMVKALKAENVKGKTLDQVKEQDKKQKAQAGVADYMRFLMDSECGKHLRGIQESAPYYAEIFVMDNQS